MQSIDLELFGERYGWIVVVILMLVQNGGKVVDGIISLMNAAGRILRQGRHDTQAAVKAETDSKREETKAETDQDTTIIKHEIDTETTAQSNLISVQNRLLAIHEDTLEHLWKENERREANDIAQREAINADRMAILRMESTLSLHTMTLSRLAERDMRQEDD